MRIAIVDDLKTERALLKERLSHQLALRGVEALTQKSCDRPCRRPPPDRKSGRDVDSGTYPTPF